MDSFLESEVKRNPYSLKLWIRYIDSKSDDEKLIVFNEALPFLPRSYKLWRYYLLCKCNAFPHSFVSKSKQLLDLIDLYEKALHLLNKMPRLWLDYCALLSKSSLVTFTRKTYDRAFSALPITQHSELWDNYINWCSAMDISELSIKIFKRFIMFDPSGHEKFLDYLLKFKQYKHIVVYLTENFNSFLKSYESCCKLIEECSINADSITNSNSFEILMRSCLSHFPDDVGYLWTQLAEFYVRKGNFQRAYDVYEEAMDSVLTVKDFTLVFESYVRIMESLITQRMADDEDASDIDLIISKLEFLVENRSLYINSVHLRQNPNNVVEWMKRLKFVGEKQKLITFIEALKTIDAKMAIGKLSGIWLELTNYYLAKNDLANVRSVFEKAVRVPYKSANENAFMWTSWAEFEIMQGDVPRARAIILEALKLSSNQKGDGALTRLDTANDSKFVFLNLKVWSLYLDLEENIGTVDSCRAAYEKILELRIITISMVLNYTKYLEKMTYFEESFQFFEKAIKLFSFPEAKILWVRYIKQFVDRYGSSKLERLRDIFEEVIRCCPSDSIAEFYILYANLEESFGYEKAAVTLLDRCISAIPTEQRLAMYLLLIRKIEKIYGVTKTRPVYERSIFDLDDTSTKVMCLDYADTERKLGEVDRARVILRHGCQLADPKRDLDYWDYWRQFEEAHGNEDTFRDMLRIKRSVETAFSHVHYIDNSDIKNASDMQFLKRRKV